MSTATDILDLREELGFGEDSHEQAIGFALFTMCSECGHVDGTMTTLRHAPCQTCAKIVDTRMILFSGDEVAHLEMIFECYRSKTMKQMSVVLFCILIEQHIDQLLLRRCRRLGIQMSMLRLLLEKHDRVDDRMKLFEKLCGVKFRDALEKPLFVEVFRIYDVLRKKRNLLAHGKRGARHFVSADDIKSAVNAAARSFACFAHLHHKFCSIDAPKMPDH